MSIIIDGMSTVLFPMQIPIPKGTSRVERMKLHVHGIINHGQHSKTYFGCLNHWGHGSNYIATLIIQYIHQLIQSLPLDQFPHTLYLQVDNCWKENKNKTIFAIAGMLILSG